MIEYINTPPVIGTIVTSRLATLYELQTVYGAEDAYDLLELVNINKHNEAVLNANDH